MSEIIKHEHNCSNSHIWWYEFFMIKSEEGLVPDHVYKARAEFMRELSLKVVVVQRTRPLERRGFG